MQAIASFTSFWQRGDAPHLGAREFRQMALVACGLHLLLFVALAVIPSDEVEQIPVRTIQLKLGADVRMVARPHIAPALPPLEPVQVANLDVKPEPKREQKINPYDSRDTSNGFLQPPPSVKPLPKAPAKIASRRVPVAQPQKSAPLSSWQAKPKQYVRENAASQRTAAEVKTTSQAMAIPVGRPVTAPLNAAQKAEFEREIKARYERQISQWLARHKQYPAEAKKQRMQGRPMVRLRINRGGKVLYSAIEVSSGHKLIDAAALQMVQRADPFPAPPGDYPGAQMLEFLIPIRFDLNQ